VKYDEKMRKMNRRNERRYRIEEEEARRGEEAIKLLCML